MQTGQITVAWAIFTGTWTPHKTARRISRDFSHARNPLAPAKF